MHFERETTQANVIRSLESGRTRIGERWIAGHIIVSSEHVVENWALDDPSKLTLEILEPALNLEPEVLIVGMGHGQVLPNTMLMAALAKRGIGIEFMNTAAACRTYNILIHEDRSAVAALFNPATID